MENKPVYYPPSQNLTYQNPTWTRIFLWIMHAVGWILFVPTLITTIACILAIIFGICTWVFGITGFWSIVQWFMMLAVSGGIMVLGWFMTGRMTRNVG
jgi:hypothetical protein